MSKSKNKQRFGLFYKSHGEWTKSPYAGRSFTQYSLTHNPIKNDIGWLQNHVLKSRIQVRPISA